MKTNDGRFLRRDFLKSGLAAAKNKDDLGFAVVDRHVEQRKRDLDAIEERMPPLPGDDPPEQVFRRLDAVREMVANRQRRKGGCIIGNLSTALADTHPKFRKRLAACFDEMAGEFTPLLDAAAERSATRRVPDALELSRYIVTIIEGAIVPSRTHREPGLVDRQFRLLKQYLRGIFRN
jgi:AcrR family transcriptional regulator